VRALASGFAAALIALVPAAPSHAATTAAYPEAGVTQFSSPSAIAANTGVPGSAWDPVAIGAPGGPAMVDAYGRVVTLHGVNAVYKRPPYELTVTPGQPWSFTAADAAQVARLGFDVVRLGILWQGLEPGSGGPNSPVICHGGTPGDPQMLSYPTAQAYLAQVAQVVDLLGRYHVHTILDMHQDVYSQAFSGEGAPRWAVCTDGIPIKILPGRWSRNYANPALNVAVDHFFANDVVGNLQGEFDRVWGMVAADFRTNPWIVGYDPYNEPFSRALTDAHGTGGEADVAAALECFYTGRAQPGWTIGGVRLRCPATVPALGVVPTIEAVDPNHLVFVEPDIYTEHGAPDLLGPMPFGRLVLNFHAYCGHRSPVTGDPTNAPQCASRVDSQMLARQRERSALDSPQQPGGPAWIMSEFGATHSTAVLDAITATARTMDLSWAYWSWSYYDDPTGSSHEALVQAEGAPGPQALSLATPYAEAVAGATVSESFDPGSLGYELRYRPRSSISAPTVVIVPAVRYPAGFCTEVTGGTIGSEPGAQHLLVWNSAGAAQVVVEVTPARCAAQPLEVLPGKQLSSA